MKNWKNLGRRGLSLLVCLMMCLSMLPSVAYAGEAELDEHEHIHEDEYAADLGIAALADEDETTPCQHSNCSSVVWDPGTSSKTTYRRDVCNDCGAWRWNFYWWGWEGLAEARCTTEYYDEDITPIPPQDPNKTSCDHSNAICKDGTTCPDCGAAIEAKPHQFGEWTYWATGNHEEFRKCSVCEYVETRSKDHVWKEDTVTKKATCTEDGEKTLKCVFYCCTETKTETIPKLGHSMTKTLAKSATCTEPGNNEYWTCSRCNKVFKDEAGETVTTVEAETIAAKGHNLVDDVAVAATCTSTGLTAGKHCDRCDYVETKRKAKPSNSPASITKAPEAYASGADFFCKAVSLGKTDCATGAKLISPVIQGFLNRQV